MGRLEGKVALVTGAASGLGEGISHRLVEEGARVILADVQDELGQQLATELSSTYTSLDVRDEPAWQRCIEEIIQNDGQLDVLVNNAGIFNSIPVDKMPLSDWQRIIDVNLTGVFLGCKHGVKTMKQNPNNSGGSIINLSSVVGLRGQRGGAAYSASKGGVRLLTKTVALENAAIGIRCNSIHPGIIKTPILDPMFAATDDPDALEAGMASQLPIGYLGEAKHDIGNTALFLASDESRYITGSEHVVDGGMTIGL